MDAIADNVLETIQKLVQDVIAPEAREVKARVDGFEHRVDDHREIGAIRERVAVLDMRLKSSERAAQGIRRLRTSSAGR